MISSSPPPLSNLDQDQVQTQTNTQRQRQTESSTILSGMLLNHCLIYGSIDQNQDQSGEMDGIPNSTEDIAMLVFKFSPHILTVKSQVAYANLSRFLNTGIAKKVVDSVLWLHLTSKSSLSQIINHYDLPSNIYTIFSDSSVYARFHSLGRSEYVTQIVTTNMQDNIINVKKLHIYFSSGLVLTFEQRSHAVFDNLNTFEYNSIPIINPVSLTRGTSINIGSELNMDGSFTDDSSPTKFSGILLDTIMKRIEKENVKQQIYSQGVSYLVIELIRAMLQISLPVIHIHAREMLKLHDNVFLRKKKPDYHEGRFYMDQIEVFKLSYNLVHTMLHESHRIFDMADVEYFPSDQIQDLEHRYHQALMQVEKLQHELDRIHSNLQELITRRNDRVHLMLTMTATIFLPLTFITGVFGMNFTNGGALVYILHVINGTYAFLVISLTSVFILLFWFYYEGFLDMLATREVNKHINDLQKQQKSLVPQLHRRESYRSTIKSALSFHPTNQQSLLPPPPPPPPPSSSSIVKLVNQPIVGNPTNSEKKESDFMT